MDHFKVIANRYKVLELLGTGGYGKVFKVLDQSKRQEFALKIDLSEANSCLNESRILKDLEGGVGIPKLHDYGKDGNNSFMVLDLLGPNLSKLRKEAKDFSLNTVCLIMLQALSRLEFLHDAGYVHRDVKPHQFLASKNEIIYLVDYGISKKFIIDGNHISYQSLGMKSGSLNYASLNSHMGIRLSRRDDLESVMYMCSFLIDGILPWQGPSKLEGIQKWQEVFYKKRDVRAEKLFPSNLPQLWTMLLYIKALKFSQEPDYDYLRSQITSIQTQFSLKSLDYDWNILEKPENKPEKLKKHHRTNYTKKKKKTTKVKIQSRKPRTSKTFCNLNMFGDSIEAPKILLGIPLQEFKSLSDTASGKSSNNEISEEETIKNLLPEFVDRKKIFGHL